jgi:hypothetical protein
MVGLSSRGTSLSESATGVRGLISVRRLWFAGIILAAAFYDLLLLSNGDLRLFGPEFLDGAFNSMLLNLLHGDFTVARSAIGLEAWSRNGYAYSYFGVFPAFLRLLAMPFMDIAHAHLARLSCLTAMVLFLAFQLQTLLVVHDSLPPAKKWPLLLVVMVAATVLSGPQLYLLGSAWIYNEPVLWSAAFGAAFNLVVVRAAVGEGTLGIVDLVVLAVLAGLAINTRASIGVALYLATGLLAAGAALSFRLPSVRRLVAAAPRMAADRHVWLPLLILAAFALIAGVVNYNRWGNPLTFADFRYADVARHHPLMMAVVRNYGDFNVTRIGTSLLYYATGIPFLLKGVSPFSEYLHARFLQLQAPPSAALLTNPLTIILAALGLYRLVWRPDIRAEGVAMLRLALIGHAAAVFLILAAIFLALRYRLDFAPFMTLAAFIGYRSFAFAAADAPDDRRRTIRVAAISLCALGIVCSHYVLVLDKVWSYGEPMEVRRALLPLAPFAHDAVEY